VSFGVQIGINFDTNSETDFIDWLNFMIYNTNQNCLEQLAYTIDSIWYARNMKIFQNQDIDDDITIRMATEKAKEYQPTVNLTNSNIRESNTTNTSNNNNRNSKSLNKWCKPSQGLYKINCDVNLSHEGIWGLGDVVHDSNDIVLAATTWQMKGFDDPAAAEAMAMAKAMEFASQCCFTRR
jgi:hypothetical protein